MSIKCSCTSWTVVLCIQWTIFFHAAHSIASCQWPTCNDLDSQVCLEALQALFAQDCFSAELVCPLLTRVFQSLGSLATAWSDMLADLWQQSRDPDVGLRAFEAAAKTLCVWKCDQSDSACTDLMLDTMAALQEKVSLVICLPPTCELLLHGFCSCRILPEYQSQTQAS